LFKKIRNITIIFLLLISTTGVSLSKHYSGGTLYSVSLIGDAESCCEVPCECCNDETDFMKLDVDYLISTFDNPEIKIIDLLIDSEFIVSSFDSFEFLSIDIFKYYPDISPPKEEEHLSFFQSFLC